MGASRSFCFSDSDLFGNDIAEDEIEDVFEAYACEVPEVERFIDSKNPIQITRAYKGEGKSALMRIAKSKIASRKNTLIIDLKGSSIAPSVSDFDPHIWVRAWKSKIMEQIAYEIGNNINIAWTDDAISLVTESEKAGFKRRNIFSVVFDRIKISSLPLDKKELALTNAEKAVKRHIANKTEVWIFIDDVDLNFKNDPQYRNKIANFFHACRELANSNNGLKFRLSIRPNIWAILKSEYEALSHVDQYAFDLTWDEDSARHFLARRIEGYAKRHLINIDIDSHHDEETRDKIIISSVFGESYPWNNTSRPPHVAIFTLANHRPRWMVILCRLAGIHAEKKNSRIIKIDHFSEVLNTFGEGRLMDIIAEFRPQCPDIQDLIYSFEGSKEEFDKAGILKYIKEKTLMSDRQYIIGNKLKASPDVILNFLHQIGLFYPRLDEIGGSYDHIKYHRMPGLALSSAENHNFKWEMHPAFRQALKVRDSAGKKINIARI